MIFASIDLSNGSLDEILSSLLDIKNSKFDGVEICLWENMLKYSEQIKASLENVGLYSNVHGDLMREREGLEKCFDKLQYSIDFSRSIGSKFFISHPIKPYLKKLYDSKKLFDKYKYDRLLIESVREIGIQELRILGNPIVMDIGNIIKNGEYPVLKEYNNAKWAHIHDFKGGIDHIPIGKGELDFGYILRILPEIGFTIELNNEFRRWSELRGDYRDSIDYLNNQILSNKSYGKNVRLSHLLNLVGKNRFKRAIEIGCGEGYLLHNITANNKVGYDINPKELFNDIVYNLRDIRTKFNDNADLVICSEVIEHMEDDISLIKQLHNTLMPGGLIFLSTINNNISEDKSRLDLERGHFRRYDIGLKTEMEQIGFNTIAFYPFRSKHYYNHKGAFGEYNREEDLKSDTENASGWIYFGCKV